MSNIAPTQDVEEIIELLRKPHPKEGEELIRRAYEKAEKAHALQKRSSGEPYVNHVFEVAKILARLKMDIPTIAAGLLHDVVEDGLVNESELQKEFGKEIAFLVDGVTKLGKYEYRGIERHAESLRKFLIATSKDIRVLIIRLADRLHNMRTLEFLDREDKMKRIALETLEIYAPLANRLGMGQIKGELEDLAFPYVHLKEYDETKKLHHERSKDVEKRLEKVSRGLQKALHEEDVSLVAIDARIKHYYSFYKKLLKNDMDPEKVYDIAALRVVVENIADCYRVLGIVHNLWKPLPGRIKDYISAPKLNGYQSLHTTIFTGDGGILEIQIRTKEMHEEAEFGIAAHLTYKEGVTKKRGQKLSKKLLWIEELTEWQKHIAESGEFLETLKMDFFKDRVFVFTPEGDVIDLPEGSTPIDFAYTIHSDVGNHAFGSKINNKMVPLSTSLQNGDIVEILVKKKSSPSRKWLDFVHTINAKKHIRLYFDRER